MLLLGRLNTHMAPRRRGGKSISISGDRGDNAITKNGGEGETGHVSDFLTVVSILGGVKAAVIVLKLRKNHTN